MRRILVVMMAIAGMVAFAAGPTITDEIAKQRYPWNGLVDITCTVSGINGTTNGLKFAVSAVMPDSGDVRRVYHFWVVRNGTNSTDWTVHTNGNYRLVWDAQADLGQVVYSNMVMRVAVIDIHGKVQLWKSGPHWATTNVGAEEPYEYGYYFVWSDVVGYMREGNAWVTTEGSSSSSMNYGTPTYGKSMSSLQSEGWITSDGALAPEHDAAHVHWGGGWRMPTKQELSDLNSKCDWTLTTTNGVTGYLVCGRGNYASNSIFLPCAGDGRGTSLDGVGSHGRYWSSVPDSDDIGAWYLYFDSSGHRMGLEWRTNGYPVRPVQGFTE